MTNDLAPRRVRARPGRERGLTLVELVVTIGIVAIVLAVAVPSFADAILSNKLSSMSNAFSASTQVARSEAIKRNATTGKPVKMCASSDGVNCATSGGWHQGWIVFHDADNSHAINGSETLVHRESALPNGFYLTGGSNLRITFLGTGVVDSGTASYKLCRYAPSVGSQDREVALGTTGRVQIKKTQTGTCEP